MYFNEICRVLVLAIGWIIFLSSYIPVHLLLKGQDKLRKKIEVPIINLSKLLLYPIYIEHNCEKFVFSISGSSKFLYKWLLQTG
jgi:hypothetical protein